jgi:hypothetical protein
VEGLGVLLDTGHAVACGEDPAGMRCGGWAIAPPRHLGDRRAGGGDDDLPVRELHDFGVVSACS